MSTSARTRSIVLLLAAGSLACATAPPDGDSVHIADESAIIIWDAATKTQHFVRRASFDTSAKNFGFLVPTPGVPELAEADSKAFGQLDLVIDPPELRKARKSAPKNPPQLASLSAVAVVATAKVAGLDATVLAATDAGALDRWLQEHGYASSPALVEWYRPYIEKRWYLTAFKIASGADGTKRVDADAVRMSFKSDQPFFPYREPKQDHAGKPAPGPRLLQVYFIAAERGEGTLASGATWSGRTAWSGTLDGAARKELARQLRLPVGDLAATSRLTLFQDAVLERSGDADLYFVRASDQSELNPQRELLRRIDVERKAHYWSSLFGWIIVALVIAAVIGFISWAVRRIRRA